LGRLLITLYLVDTEVLKKPVLYLSDYFEKNRMEYFDCLSQVREKNELSRWLIFFMKGVIATSQNSINSLQAILELKKDCEENRIYHLGKRIKVAKVLLDYLFQQPVLGAEDVSNATGLSLVSSYKLLNDFITKGILKEATGFKRNRIFLFEEYFTIFKK
jgi:Fic family protein